MTGTTLTIASPTVAMSGNQYHAVFTNTCNWNEDGHHQCGDADGEQGDADLRYQRLR